MKKLMIAGAVNGMLAVALGAFGAHGLKEKLSPEMLDVFKTGVQYHMYHALALLLVALATSKLGDDGVKWPGRLFMTGIVLFSGSLYVLSISDVKWLGAITPFGGVCFIAGWLLFAHAAYKKL